MHAKSLAHVLQASINEDRNTHQDTHAHTYILKWLPKASLMTSLFGTMSTYKHGGNMADPVELGNNKTQTFAKFTLESHFNTLLPHQADFFISLELTWMSCVVSAVCIYINIYMFIYFIPYTLLASVLYYTLKTHNSRSKRTVHMYGDANTHAHLHQLASKNI